MLAPDCLFRCQDFNYSSKRGKRLSLVISFWWELTWQAVQRLDLEFSFTVSAKADDVFPCQPTWPSQALCRSLKSAGWSFCGDNWANYWGLGRWRWCWSWCWMLMLMLNAGCWMLISDAKVLGKLLGTCTLVLMLWWMLMLMVWANHWGLGCWC